MAQGRRIGFVDYKLENFHANIYLKILRGELKHRGFEVAGCWAIDQASGREWAAKNAVPWSASVEALDQQADFFMVLAPSDPQTHLALCEKVFPFGKPTYVDKTFAPDLATARRIFELTDRHGVTMQTSSALRYTNVQDEVKQIGAEQIRHIITWGGGSSFGEYSVHPLELAISCMGADATAVMRRGDERFSQLLIDFTGGRSAVVNVYCAGNTPFAAAITTEKETRHIRVDDSRIFVNQTNAILDMFETGRVGIDRRQTLMIRQIQDVCASDAARKGFVQLDRV